MSKYRFNQIVNTYDSLPDGRTNPTSILNYFQEVAQRQIESLGLGVEYLLEHHRAWVLVKYEIDYHKYPKAEEEIIVETEPTGINRFEAYREFHLYSLDGEELVTGRSVWVYIDTESKKMVRINEEKDLMEAFYKDKPKIIRIPRLERVSDFDHETSFKIRYLDIDVNYHVNNVKYLSWALEVLPLDIVKNNEIKKLTIYFKEQAFYGERVFVKGKEINPLEYRINVEKEDGTVLSELKIEGRKIQES